MALKKGRLRAMLCSRGAPTRVALAIQGTYLCDLFNWISTSCLDDPYRDVVKDPVWRGYGCKFREWRCSATKVNPLNIALLPLVLPHHRRDFLSATCERGEVRDRQMSAEIKSMSEIVKLCFFTEFVLYW